MNRYTLTHEISDTYKVKINSSKQGLFCWFEYVAKPIASEGIEVQLGVNPHASTQRWFADVKRGILRGIEKAREDRQQDLVGIRITITRVISHDIDTTTYACEQSGSKLVLDHLAVAVSLAEPGPQSRRMDKDWANFLAGGTVLIHGEAKTPRLLLAEEGPPRASV